MRQFVVERAEVGRAPKYLQQNPVESRLELAIFGDGLRSVSKHEVKVHESHVAVLAVIDRLLLQRLYELPVDDEVGTGHRNLADSIEISRQQLALLAVGHAAEREDECADRKRQR